MSKYLIIAVMLVSGPRPAWAQFFDQFAGSSNPADDVLQVSTAWSQTAARPGDQLALAVVIELKDRWHIYADKAQQIIQSGGFEPRATVLDVAKSPDVLKWGTVRYAPPHELNDQAVKAVLQVYEGRTIFVVPVTVSAEALPTRAQVQLSLHYQACDDSTCLMPKTVTVLSILEIVDAGTTVEQANTELFGGLDGSTTAPSNPADAPVHGVKFDIFGAGFTVNASTAWGLLALLLAAAAGGLLLNFTPCVLPIIPIKIMGLSQAAGNRARCFTLGLIMSLGVIAFWITLGIVISLVSGFTAANQLFQYPAFTITVGLVIAVMAVGMCGLFAVNLPQWVYLINPQHDTATGSFGFGVMTAVLSTPCTAPFMGSAAAWATTQSPFITILTFAAIGIGMALPYLVLSAKPSLVEKMPRGGPAGELIKQVMGLFMLAAAAYFLGVGLSALFVTAPEPPSLAYWWVVTAIIAVAGIWLTYGTFRVTPSVAKRAGYAGVGVLMMVAAIWGGRQLTDRGPIDWVYYTPERFNNALGKGNVVVMDFTAEWCLNCKALEHTVLQTGPVIELLKRDDVVPMKVDITGNNAPGNEMLTQVGRVTIPALVVFASNGEQVFNSDAYNARQVIQAVHDAD